MSSDSAGTADGSDTDRIDADTPADTAGSDETAAEPPLRVENLRKEFGGITAVDGASFAVAEESLTGLIGPNGAGKSTTFNCITGIHEPTAGAVYLNGENIAGLAPNVVADRGLVRTFQIARELAEMTVLENLMLAPQRQQGETLYRSVLPTFRDDVIEEETELREAVWESLEFFEIDHLAEEQAGTLSGGQRKLLEMARALMTDPDILLLDEPFAGVNPSLETKLLDRINQLRAEEGLTFLLVEHDMDIIMEHCDPVIVMHQGQVLAEGPPEAIRNNERVVDAYFGDQQ